MSSEIVPAKPGDIVLYQTAQGNPEIECVFHGENMWLTQAQMVELYQVSKSSISEHVKHIFEEGELDPNAVVRKFRTTAAETIMQRADTQQPFMGLTVFEGNQPTREEVEIAKNYLNDKELRRLNNMVSAFFDLAETQAEEHHPMYMADWVRELDDFAQRYGKGVLVGPGKVSHKAAMTKAHKEYDAYKQRLIDEPTVVERDYLEGLKGIQKQLEDGE